jgi:hypothetical protein
MPATIAREPNAVVLKPFAILAAIAFVAGFMGYLATAQTSLETLQAAMQPAPMIASPNTGPAQASVDAGDWNLPKKI